MLFHFNSYYAGWPDTDDGWKTLLQQCQCVRDTWSKSSIQPTDTQCVHQPWCCSQQVRVSVFREVFWMLDSEECSNDDVGWWNALQNWRCDVILGTNWKPFFKHRYWFTGQEKIQFYNLLIATIHVTINHGEDCLKIVIWLGCLAKPVFGTHIGTAIYWDNDIVLLLPGWKYCCKARNGDSVYSLVSWCCHPWSKSWCRVVFHYLLHSFILAYSFWLRYDNIIIFKCYICNLRYAGDVVVISG